MQKTAILNDSKNYRIYLKGERSTVVSIYWSKVLNKPFILMQNRPRNKGYGGLNIFKMAVMDAAIL